MKNNIDFTYEYSTINLFQTKVNILTGKYAGIEIEFANSGVMHGHGYPLFNFQYQLYKTPDDFNINSKFEDYLTKLLIAVIDDRNKDPQAKEKLENAAGLQFIPSPVAYFEATRKLSYSQSKILINMTFRNYVVEVYINPMLEKMYALQDKIHDYFMTHFKFLNK